jgi:hypothetical protein
MSPEEKIRAVLAVLLAGCTVQIVGLRFRFFTKGTHVPNMFEGVIHIRDASTRQMVNEIRPTACATGWRNGQTGTPGISASGRNARQNAGTPCA